MENDLDQKEWDVVIVGAGMCGLMAARKLMAAGRRVIVIDKGRGVGGRMAYRRIGEAIFDHGAQYISVKSDGFQKSMREWQENGAAVVWSEGFADLPGDHPRWRGAPHMKAIPSLLAAGLPVLTNAKITEISKHGDRWEVVLENEIRYVSGALIMTPPVPQSVDLLGGIFREFPGEMRAQLERLTYHRCFAVMAVLDGASGLPSPGVRTFRDGSLAWMADNQMKGISPVPCVTIHASHDYSLARWEEDRQETARMMIAEASPWLAAQVTEFQIHGWRYSKPAVMHDAPFFLLHDEPYLAFAGDAFRASAGDAFGIIHRGNVEGAATSGWAVAENVIEFFSQK